MQVIKGGKGKPNRKSQLEEALQVLRAEMAALEEEIPDEDSEEYEDWAEAHEALEDEIDDILDELDEL